MGIAARRACLLFAATTVAQSLPSNAIVRGRCVAAGSRAPLAGARVELGGWTGSTDEMQRHGNPTAPKLDPVLTDADGKFEFAFVPPPPLQWSLDIRLEGVAPRTARWGHLQPGQVEDLGTIDLQPGFKVRGKVVDEKGEPAAKCQVSIKRLPLPIRADMAANDTRGPSSTHTWTYTCQRYSSQ